MDTFNSLKESLISSMKKASNDSFLYTAAAFVSAMASGTNDFSSELIKKWKEGGIDASDADLQLLIKYLFSKDFMNELDSISQSKGLGTLKTALTAKYTSETLDAQKKRITDSFKSKAKNISVILGVGLVGGVAGYFIAKKMNKSSVLGVIIGYAVGAGAYMLYEKMKSNGSLISTSTGTIAPTPNATSTGAITDKTKK